MTNNYLIFNRSFSLKNAVEGFLRAADSLRIPLTPLAGANLEVCFPQPAWSLAENTGFVLFLDKDILLAKTLEAAGYRICNSAGCIEVCDDKALTALHCRRLPMPRTVAAPFTYKNMELTDFSFLSSAAAAGFPVVVKERRGSLGEQVYLARNMDELETLTRAHWRGDLIYQPLIGNPLCGEDIRVYVVGGEVTGAIKRVNDTGFRANYYAGARAYAYILNEEEKALALSAARAVGADFCGVDLLVDGEERLLLEVNSGAAFTLLDQTLGTDTAKTILTHLVNKYAD